MARRIGTRTKDLTGKQFGRWEVLSLSFVGKGKHKDAYWACLCNGCDRVYDVRSDSLQSGNSTQCMKCARQVRYW